MNLKEKHKEDEWWRRYFKSKKFQDIAAKVTQEYQEGKCITLRTPEDIDNFFNSL